MPETQRPDIIAENGIVLEMQGLPSVHVDEVKGIGKKTGTIEVVDGGSNLKIFYDDGILEYSEMTFSRIRDGSANDAKFAKLFDDCINDGKKIAFVMTQQRHGKKVLEVGFKGMLMNDLSLGDFSVDSKDASRMTYKARGEWLAKFGTL